MSLNKSPLLSSALFLTIGLVASFYFSFPFWPVFLLAFLSCALGISLSRSSASSLFLLLLLIFLGILRGGLAATRSPFCISQILHGGEAIRLIGIVQTDPFFLKGEKVSFDLRCLALKRNSEWKSVSGKLRIFALGKPAPPYGEEVMVEGIFQKPRLPGNPGAFDLAAYFKREEIDGTLSVKTYHGLSSLGKNRAGFFSRKLLSLRGKTLRRLYELLPRQEGSLFGAMILGDRSRLEGELWDLFTRTGTVHLLSISGLHVGIFATLIYFLFKLLRFRKGIAFCFTSFFLVAYGYLVGGSPPVVRSTVMILLYLLGRLLGREVFFLNILSLAYLLLLVWDPYSILDIGFQLSFLSIFFLSFAQQKMKRFLLKREKPLPLWRRPAGYFVELFTVSFGVWAGIWPVVAYHFYVVSPVGWLANCVVIPLLFPVIGVGILWFLIGPFFQALSGHLLHLEEMLLSFLMVSIRFFDKIPYGSVPLSIPGIPFLIVYYGALGVFLSRKLQHLRWKTAVALLLLGNFWSWGSLLKENSQKVEVTFLDVGHGDAIFLEFPGKRNLLIDGGDRRENFDAGRKIITPFLRKKNIRKLDAVLVTHADQDHVGGIPTLLEAFHPKYVFESGMPKESGAFRRYRDTLKKLKIEPIFLRRGERIEGYDAVSLEVLNPPDPFLRGTGKDENNNGVVLKLMHGKVRMLFTADIDEEGIKVLNRSGQNLDGDILKMPHHGSDLGSEAEPFLKAVSPQIAIISVGERETYPLPSPKTMRFLDRLGIETYQTVRSGAIQVISDGEGIRIQTYREGNKLPIY